MHTITIKNTKYLFLYDIKSKRKSKKKLPKVNCCTVSPTSGDVMHKHLNQKKSMADEDRV